MGEKGITQLKNIFETFMLTRSKWFYISEMVLENLELIISTANVVPPSRSGI